jgi:hypothetical protein
MDSTSNPLGDISDEDIDEVEANLIVDLNEESNSNVLSINTTSSIESGLTEDQTSIYGNERRNLPNLVIKTPELIPGKMSRLTSRSRGTVTTPSQSGTGFSPNPVHQKTTEHFIKNVVENHYDINIVKPMSHGRARNFQKETLNYPKLKPPSPDRSPLPPRVGLALQMPVLIVQDDPRLKIVGETNEAVQMKFKNQSNQSLNESRGVLNSIVNNSSKTRSKDNRSRSIRRTISAKNDDNEGFAEFDDTVSELSDLESIDINSNSNNGKILSLEQIVHRQASRHDVVLREMTQRYNIKRIRDKITKLEGIPLPTSISDLNSISNESMDSIYSSDGTSNFKLDENLGSNLNLELKLLREFQYSKLHHMQDRYKRDDNSSVGGSSVSGGNSIISYITTKTNGSLQSQDTLSSMSKNEKLTLQKFYPFDPQDCVHAIKKQKDIKGKFNNFVKTRYLPSLVGRYGPSHLLIKQLEKKKIVPTRSRSRGRYVTKER